MTKDLYEVLGVDKSASQTEIKKGYRAKAKEYHPDKNPGDKVAEDNFKDVAYAYEILSDEDQKAIYDTRGHAGLKGQPQQGHAHFDPFEMFSQVFGNHFGQQQNRARFDINVSISIKLEEAYNGLSKNFKYNRQIKCEPCSGVGGTEPTLCSKCNGSGFMSHIIRTRYGHQSQIRTCDQCNGKKTTFKNTCTTCQGSGSVQSREDIEITIPPTPIDLITERGAGHMMDDGTYGNLNLRVDILTNEDYQLTHDFGLISEVNVPYETLMLGGEIEFKTIDGGKVKLSVKKLSKIGTKLKLTGKGLKKPRFKHLRGDQFLVLRLEIPNSISKEEEELLKKIKKLKE
jgi:molecular chaperone DnaJ